MSPVLVLLLVTHADARVIPSAVIERAILEVLAPAKIFTEEVADTLADEEAVQVGRELHAAVVYRVTLARVDPPMVELRSWADGATTPGPWLVRRLEFGRNDTLIEIARAIGFMVAVMAPQRGRLEQRPHDQGPEGIANESSDPRLVIEHQTATATPNPSLLVDLLGSADLANGEGPAWGGELRVGWAATRWLRPTVAVTGSTETIDAAQSRASRVGLCVGGVLTVIESRRWTLALRTEAEAILQVATRPSQQQGQSVRQSRWLPALNPEVEAAAALSPRTAFVAAAGYEIAAGRTDLYVGGERLATIPSSRATLELGVRVRF